MGEGEEADPEGEVVAGPSGEAIVHSSGNMPLLLFPINLFCFFFKTSPQPFLTTFYCSIPFHCEIDFHPELCPSLLSLVYLVCRWIQRWGRKGSGNQRGTGTRDFLKPDGGGRFTSIGWRGGTKLLWEVYSLDILISPWYLLDIYMGFYFASHISIFMSHFMGLDMLKRVSSLKEETHWLEEEAQCLETAGFGKTEVVVAGSEVEGLYGLLREPYHVPP